ncbi:uncharacterized protein C2845_PM04G19300 [Panicum miliaceum]|uniref:25S rRNA (uridine-N(3))-methyltransferase BMT5-like domain-containing protein n=1 Tax=Panicum miliaceum TaxID=4540 RepID=A0A3L6QQN1_PANMI|nr:uncharacterized protein C2845_PM04G19300 [Panicum miliaceum]
MVGVASPAIGHAAAADGGGDGAGQATSVVGGSEEPMPAEGVPGMGVEGKGAGPSEGVTAAIAVEVEGEGEEEEEEEAVAAAVENEEGEKSLGCYSSTQSILLVGDGDFSFSLALATAFRSGTNIVATSLDTYEVLLGKYSEAESNVMKLKSLETTVLHGIDVKKMKSHSDLKNRRLHKSLLRGFFCTARYLLIPYGEIHVRHKTGGPYDRWDLEQLVSDSSHIMVEKEKFQIADYPGYNQKRGDGARSDQPFPLGPSCTFKFQIRDCNKWKESSKNKATSTSFLGGSNAHPSGKLETDTRVLHRLSPVQARPWLHFTPPVNTVCMPIPPQPYIVAQRQQPDPPQVGD